MKFDNKKVLIAMSGGVDSSVSAYILKKIGYNVEGVFMKNWNYKKKCNSAQDYIDAKLISEILNIKLHIIDTSKIYWNKVFKKILLEYKAGKTPNPDILCNKYIKFNNLIKLANNINAKYVSTGHYVIKKIYNKKLFLLKSRYKYNDQSYFLYTINKKKLNRCIFPLGNISKNLVRKIAKKNNFINYNKPSSKGICFINNKNFSKFISNFIKNNYGNILTQDFRIIGKHNGCHNYTIGQRKGLNIGGVKDFKSLPWYVIKKDIKKNIIYVSQNKKDNILSIGLIIKKIHWISYVPKNTKLYLSVKIRYSEKTIKSILYINKLSIIIFKNYIKDIVVPGQSVVFYSNNICLGGAIILKNIN